MNAMDKFLEALAELEGANLRFRPQAAAQIALGARLVDGIAVLSREDRAAIPQYSNNVTLQKNLLALSGYLAETAISRGDAGLVRVAVMLHAIEGFRWDYRENVRTLICIAHAAERLGVAMAASLAEAAAVAPGSGREGLLQFAQRDSEINALHCAGMAAEETPGAFRFVPRQWHEQFWRRPERRSPVSSE